jgi:hypothetical protein
MVISRVKDLMAGKRAAPGEAPGSLPVTRPTAASAQMPADQYFDRLSSTIGVQDTAKGSGTGPTGAQLATDLARWQPDSPTSGQPSTAPAPSVQTQDVAARRPASAAPAVAPPVSPAPAAASAAALPTLADAFVALLAAEQGKVAPPPPVNEQALRDDVIEQVTTRVIERMTDRAVRDTVAGIAERLVREEIDRIKSGS